ncbi:MAG: alcohol dehydrogenase catalytic domain-containing protein, partial [Novosphingobium sp.]|nr:alcohol dehydrogenase catalytic domain-containing protein [Novosphingobium sp.]
MQAVVFDETGGADVLRLGTVPVPRPAAGQVLIAVAFAGVNRPDVLQRQGNYPPPKGASPLMGLEVSGTIVALGEGVDPAMLGMQVCALTPGGGYAQFCVTCVGHCLPVPPGLPMAEAAALPETL